MGYWLHNLRQIGNRRCFVRRRLRRRCGLFQNVRRLDRFRGFRVGNDGWNRVFVLGNRELRSGWWRGGELLYDNPWFFLWDLGSSGFGQCFRIDFGL